MKLVGRKGGPWLSELQKYLIETVLENPVLTHPEDSATIAEAQLAEEGS